jgi:hypothetical protein
MSDKLGGIGDKVHPIFTLILLLMSIYHNIVISSNESMIEKMANDMKELNHLVK